MTEFSILRGIEPMTVVAYMPAHGALDIEPPADFSAGDMFAVTIADDGAVQAWSDCPSEELSSGCVRVYARRGTPA